MIVSLAEFRAMVTWSTVLMGCGAGLVIAMVTSPVGVSGAVFLLPVQLSVLGVPNPAVTPTNLLYNVVAGPGALYRYWRAGQLHGSLTRVLIWGTLPGVVLGAVIRVFAIPGPEVFRVIVAAVLLPLGLWLCVRTFWVAKIQPARGLSVRSIRALAFVVGTVGGIYGIGGGSLLGPILVGRGMPVAKVAPAALATTFVTSFAGVLAYSVMSLTATGEIAPNWMVGLSCGIGGLVGGYFGARLQPRMPERALRLVLGMLAVALAVMYIL
ncbi:sulfite exporter TauE/SafE family protein [Kibdelosporangium philippinense]|uniref:Probable membrane transporter protein n=1 Tax=Kibdelosporangium philippinense TaxID=211113 RepID=A0ABS8Z9N1_9PSEU|nr:sulfite exporter TauE/SafE family protein [Kibdelosporangium philippinense]MCE7004591.1 sulfite exporter TauE/SafE family protein [Kibdelosporangium philippinense]